MNLNDEDLKLLEHLERVLEYYLEKNGPHASTILRSYAISSPEGRENCRVDIINLLAKALDFEK